MIDLVGQKFGRLTVIKEAARRGNRGWVRYWLCRCDCGREKEVQNSNLTCGTTLSCGCLQRERMSKRTRKHGHTTGPRWTGEYLAWIRMKQRCYNPETDSYERYGGRGIRVAGVWLNDFPAFLAHVGRKPTRQHSLDRINNDKNYEPGNVRWATRSEQQQNRERTRTVVVDGKSVPITILAKQHGINSGVIAKRLSLGWPIERALTQPIRKKANGRRASA